MSSAPIQLSFCIPIYNGAATLRATLDSIISQVSPANASRLEIVLCDDASRDETAAIAKEYADRHAFVRFFRNEKNLGMDGNFRQTALHARGEFIWYSGQDDIFGAGVVDKVFSLIDSTENLGFVYINYSQMDHDMKRVLVRSVLSTPPLAQDSAGFVEGEDIVCTRPEKFFAKFRTAPTFLPATVMKRSFWLETDVRAYEGTAFNQTAVILLNLRRATMVVVTRPYIQGRIPDDQWQSKGPSHFAIFLGLIYMHTLAYRDPRNSMPTGHYEFQKRLFLREFFPLVRRTRTKGMVATPEILRRLRVVYGSSLLYWFFLLPALRLPLPCLEFASGAIRALKCVFGNRARA